MKIFFDKEFNIEFVYDDGEEVNIDANDFKVVGHGYDIDSSDDDFGIWNDEEIEELERMLNEGGGNTLLPELATDPEDYDGEPDWGKTGYGRWHWDDGDLGTYDETDGPPPTPKEDSDAKKKLTQAEVDALFKKHCNHKFVKSQGLYRVYSDCKHCGIKEEDFIASQKRK